MGTPSTQLGSPGAVGWEDWSYGHRGRITASILGPVAWLSFTLIYVGFLAQGFTLFQSLVVVLVSALLLGGLMGVIWTWWAPPRDTLRK